MSYSENERRFVCQYRSTLTCDLEVAGTCDAELARDLRAESHMYGWLGVTVAALTIVLAVGIKKAISPFSYFQDMWVGAYRKVLSCL